MAEELGCPNTSGGGEFMISGKLVKARRPAQVPSLSVPCSDPWGGVRKGCLIWLSTLPFPDTL